MQPCIKQQLERRQTSLSDISIATISKNIKTIAGLLVDITSYCSMQCSLNLTRRQVSLLQNVIFEKGVSLVQQKMQAYHCAVKTIEVPLYVRVYEADYGTASVKRFSDFHPLCLLLPSQKLQIFGCRSKFCGC